jgi:hypothetical protein
LANIENCLIKSNVDIAPAKLACPERQSNGVSSSDWSGVLACITRIVPARGNFSALPTSGKFRTATREDGNLLLLTKRNQYFELLALGSRIGARACGDDPQPVLLHRGWQCVKIRNKLGWLHVCCVRVTHCEATAMAIDLRDAIRQHVHGKSLRPLGLSGDAQRYPRKPNSYCNAVRSHTPNETKLSHGSGRRKWQLGKAH